MPRVTRPVTINSVWHAQRWFPNLFRHTDGSFLLYVQHGYDMSFAPVHRLRSTDQGRTWVEETENVPRLAIAHAFADGELLEIDAYGVPFKDKPGTWVYYAAWSVPGTARAVEHAFMEVESPSLGHYPLSNLGDAYPKHPWWRLFNYSVNKEEVGEDEIGWRGAVFTDIREVGDRLLAVAYGYHKDDIDLKAGKCLCSLFCYESWDRGRTWREIGLIGRGRPDLPEGFDEATLTVLADGRLYSVIRTGAALHHSWSVDGRCWSEPVPLVSLGGEKLPWAWPRCIRTLGGALILACGRPGKVLLIDRTGTGTAWEMLFDLHAWELNTQELNGVPLELRLRGDTGNYIRYWDSSDYLSVVEDVDASLCVTYDVQNYLENWNSNPASAVRFLRVYPV